MSVIEGTDGEGMKMGVTKREGDRGKREGGRWRQRGGGG